jgi:hypothetical protein
LIGLVVSVLWDLVFLTIEIIDTSYLEAGYLAILAGEFDMELVQKWRNTFLKFARMCRHNFLKKRHFWTIPKENQCN